MRKLGRLSGLDPGERDGKLGCHEHGGTDEWLQILWVLVKAKKLATMQAGMVNCAGALDVGRDPG